MIVFLNLIFPERHICFVCGEYGRDIRDNLCVICREKLVFIDSSDSCSICGRLVHYGSEDTNDIQKIKKCSLCIKTPHEFKKSVSTLSYEGEIKRLIYNFKYNGESFQYKMFSKLMTHSALSNDFEFLDLIIPVPLHKVRMKKRGFNQAALLGKEIGKSLGVETDTETLKRIHFTNVQNQLSREERLKNIRDVFHIEDNSKIIAKKILIVDDIYTTGATVDECASVLKKQGACEVFVLTLAATPNGDTETDTETETEFH